MAAPVPLNHTVVCGLVTTYDRRVRLCALHWHHCCVRPVGRGSVAAMMRAERELDRRGWR